MKFGLTDKVIEKLKAVFEENSNVDKAIIFGSRAKGNYKDGSDIDIALQGQYLNFDDILKLHVKLDDLNLAYEIDLLNYKTIEETALKEHIDRVGIVFYSRWKKYKLFEITEPVKQTFNPDGSDDFVYIGLEHIEAETLRLNSVGKSSDVISNKFLFKHSDVLFGKLRPYFRKVVQPKFNGICSTDIWVFRAKEKADQNFLFYFLANWDFVNTADGGEGGSRMPRADWSFLKETEWYLPPVMDQKEIASVLRSLDDKIDLLHRQNKTLEQLAETLFRQWFVEEAEESWEKNNINSIASVIQYGYTQSASEEKVGPKFLRITDIQGGVINWDTVPYCKINEKEIHKYKLKTGDIVVARTGASTGENIYLHKPEESVFASYLIRLQFSNLYLARFIGLLMRSYEYRGYIEGILSGSAQPNANASELTSFQVQIPSPEKLQVFYKKVTELDEKKYSNNNQINALTQLRDTLLPRLMSGEVRVQMN